MSGWETETSTGRGKDCGRWPSGGLNYRRGSLEVSETREERTRHTPIPMPRALTTWQDMRFLNIEGVKQGTRERVGPWR